jgi:AcrR family transcriptional regulator
MELKEKIIDAVIDEFNDKGIKFTMDDIAKRLGISKRTIYTIVQDKDTLFLEAVDKVFAAIKEYEHEIIEDTQLDLVDKLKKLLIVLPQRYKTIDFSQLYDLKNKFPRIYSKIENRLETDWEPTFRIMEQAMEEGRIRKISLPVFQAIISGTIEYYLSRSILIDNEIVYEDALQQMLDIIFDGICTERSSV